MSDDKKKDKELDVDTSKNDENAHREDGTKNTSDDTAAHGVSTSDSSDTLEGTAFLKDSEENPQEEGSQEASKEETGESSSPDLKEQDGAAEENTEGKRPEEEAEDASAEEEIRFYKGRIKFGIAAIIVIILSAGAAWGLSSFLDQRQADRELQELAEAETEIEAINTDLMSYDVGGSDGSALGIGAEGNYPSSAAFVFGSQDGSYTRIVDVYIDYSDSRSRDFFFSNNTMLRGLIESADVQLRIRPVVSENPYSAYAAEAMAQAFHRHPDKAWEVNISLLQLASESAVIDTDSAPRDTLSSIESELERYHDITDVDVSAIVSGSFSEWINAVSSDPRLAENGVPPLVFSNDNLVSPDIYYNPENLREGIMGQVAHDYSDDDVFTDE